MRSYEEKKMRRLKRQRNRIKLDLEELEDEDDCSIFYSNQIETANKIVQEIIINPNLCLATIIAPTQVGKTGTMLKIAYDMTTMFFKDEMLDKIIPKENIYFLCGLSDKEWEGQMEKRVFGNLKKQIFHRSQVKKLEVSINEKDVLEKMIIFIDECDVAGKKNQSIHNTFHRLKLDNVQFLIHNNITIIQVSATPDGMVFSADKPEWDGMHKKFFLGVGPAYTSCKKLWEQQQVKQAGDLKREKDRRKLVKFTKKNFDNKGEYRNHIIRTDKKSYDSIKKTIKSNGWEVLDYTYESRVTDIDLLIENPKNLETQRFILIKEKLRASKTIKNKNWLGILYERLPKNRINDNTIIQGLLGRMTGWAVNDRTTFNGTVFTNVDSIHRYYSKYLSNYEEKTDLRWNTSVPTSSSRNIDYLGLNTISSDDEEILYGHKLCETWNEAVEFIKSRYPGARPKHNWNDKDKYGRFKSRWRGHTIVWKLEDRIKDKKSGVGMNNGEKKYRVFPVYDKDNKEWWSVNYIKNMVADEYFDEEMNRDE